MGTTWRQGPDNAEQALQMELLEQCGGAKYLALFHHPAMTESFLRQRRDLCVLVLHVLGDYGMVMRIGK